MATASVMPISRVIGAYVAEARFESLRMLRSPAFAIPFLLLPALLYLFFAVVIAGSGARQAANSIPNAATYLFTGFSVMGVMGPGMFGFGVTVAMEREHGLLRLKRALPMPPASYLLAKMIMAMTFSAIVMITVIASAIAFSSMELSGAHYARVSMVTILGTLPFCAMGLFLGTRISGRVAPAIVNLVYLPMIYLSSLFFPLPKSIQFISVVSPAFHLDQLALAAAGIPSVLSINMHIGFLLGVTVLFAGLAAHRLARVG
jgi:ABC-2 type transport system permease protein